MNQEKTKEVEKREIPRNNRKMPTTEVHVTEATLEFTQETVCGYLWLTAQRV